MDVAADGAFPASHHDLLQASSRALTCFSQARRAFDGSRPVIDTMVKYKPIAQKRQSPAPAMKPFQQNSLLSSWPVWTILINPAIHNNP
jgi:hypothetical protein